jgi:hypothetical protein
MKLDFYNREDFFSKVNSFYQPIFKSENNAQALRFDFAITAKENDNEYGFLTGYAKSYNTCYIGLGGVFDANRGRGFSTLKVLKEIIELLLKQYTFIEFEVKNDNKQMLKLAIAINAKIIGINCYGEELFVKFQIGG